MHNEYLKRFSGVVVNQNVRPGASDYFNPTAPFVQEFVLPSNYARAGEIPSLSAIQVLVGVTDAEAFSCAWSLEYYLPGAGWTAIMPEETVTGAHHAGARVWVDLIAGEPVEIGEDMLPRRYRVRLNFTAGVDRVWYTTPNPLATSFLSAYAEDGYSDLVAGDESVCFRVLGLVADEGVDFLGNNYRSMIRSATSQNINPISGVPDAIWMSKPNPSRFAIENLYFDIRPRIEAVSYGELVNLVPNPRFAIDSYGWTQALTAGLLNPIHERAALPAGANLPGEYGFRASATQPNDTTARTIGMVPFSNATATPVKPNTVYTLIAEVYVESISDFAARLDVFAIDESFVQTGSSGGSITAITLGWNRLVRTYTTPPDTAYLRPNPEFRTSTANASVDGYFTRIMVVEGDLLADPPDFFDGDSYGYTWLGLPHTSPSLEVIQPEVEDNVRVVDRITVDPVTPGVYFNVYYSTEGDPGENEDDWDNKLWTRVPITFRADKKETHAFPRPISAKYVKVEFSHLQAKHYNPGSLARLIKYKKHPKWVLDYFMARVEAHRAVESDLISGRIGIIYDAMDLAYNYYLDDLVATADTLPERTVEITNFLNDRTDYSDQVDPIMLEKIRLAMTPYEDHFVNWAKPSTILGAFALDETDRQNAPVERPTVPVPEVGELRNAQVVYEQSFPVMFFYLTCRHKYREIVAPLTQDRAYFVGIRELAFTREHYATAHDNGEYIEPGADLLNVERNDFESQDGVMVV